MKNTYTINQVAKIVVATFGNKGFTSHELVDKGLELLKFAPNCHPTRWHKAFGNALSKSKDFIKVKTGHNVYKYYQAVYRSPAGPLFQADDNYEDVVKTSVASKKELSIKEVKHVFEDLEIETDGEPTDADVLVIAQNFFATGKIELAA